MSKRVEQLVIDELKPGERLIWQDHPASQRGKQFKTAGFGRQILILMGIMVVIAAVSVAAYGPGATILGCMLLPAAVIWVLNFRSAAHRKYRTMYVLTDRRVMIVRQKFRGKSVRSMPLEFIGHVRGEDLGADTRGTLLVQPRATGPLDIPQPMRWSKVGGAATVRDRVEYFSQERLAEIGRATGLPAAPAAVHQERQRDG